MKDCYSLDGTRTWRHFFEESKLHISANYFSWSKNSRNTAEWSPSPSNANFNKQRLSLQGSWPLCFSYTRPKFGYSNPINKFGSFVWIFAEFFSTKITNITSDCQINDNVYNGSIKINCDTSNFITSSNIINAIKSLKSKNCEGFDRIPVRYLIEGMSVITPILTHLFLLIYETKTIPQQWSIS